MRIEVTPRRLTVVPGQPAVFSVQVFNTRTVISGHRVRVLGIDPAWVEVDQDQLSLLPDSLGVAVVTIHWPKELPAGVRTVGFEVTELTPPGEITVVDVEVSVAPQVALQMSLDPASATGGRSTTVGVLIANLGNSTVDLALIGTDDERKIEFGFVPATMTLLPGEREVATARLQARQPWFGSPKVRPFSIDAGPVQPPVSALGAWVQRPRLSRGALALVGLLLAVTVFAAVITAALSRVVSTSAADRDLALQIAAAGPSSGGAGSRSGINGAVTQLTSGVGIGGVTVEVFNAANTATPLVSTASGADGGYQFAGLPAGNYVLAYRAAGFNELWYPDALTPAGATPIVLTAGKTQTGVSVRLGGVPGIISGQVVGSSSTGATIALEVPPAGGTASAVLAAGTTGTGANAPVLVTTQTLDASGNFTLSQVPSPSTYLLVVKKEGFATQVQTVDLGGGEQRTGIVISLRQGDGSISGLVSSATGPLPGATISATASVIAAAPAGATAGGAGGAPASTGTASANSVSLTQGDVGSFTLNNLPTPGSFTVTVTAPGFATNTLTLSLAPGQHLTGVAVTMATGVGSISGTATTPPGIPPGGVTVSVTNGVITLQTMTLSVAPAGTYTLTGLAVPSTYTITFSRPDLATQTKAVNLGGSATTGPGAGTTNQTGVDVSMQSATAVLFGNVTQQDNTPLGNITVSVSSGATTYSVTSATGPTPGAYEVDGIAPGTYTVSFTRPGGLPTSQIVTLAAGQRVPLNPVLALAASISGNVFQSVGNKQVPFPNAGVTLFLATQFPSTALASTKTDSTGHFVFQNLDAPQGYVVQFAPAPGATGQSTQVVNLNLSQQYVVCGPSAPTVGCPVVVSN